MTKVTLNDVGSLIDATTAAATINANAARIETGFDNTLSRDGSTPNQMNSDLDMNSNQIANLPSPATATSPLRFTDLNSFIGGGTITNIPSGGTTNQVLAKTSNTNYIVGWADSVKSVGLTLPVDFTVTGSPVTTTGTLTGNWATTPTGSGAMVRATSPTLVTPVLGVATATSVNKVALTQPVTAATLTILNNKTLTANNSLTLAGTDSTTMTFPTTSATVARTDAGNTFTGSQIVTTGDISFSTSGRGLVGTTAADAANTGNVGEMVSSFIVNGSAVSLTTGTSVNITSISLTAGDWDVYGTVYFKGGATTNVTFLQCGASSTTGTLPGEPNLLSLPVSGTPFGSVSFIGFPFPIQRISISSTTSIFMVVNSGFTVSTLSGYGNIVARRRR